MGSINAKGEEISFEDLCSLLWKTRICIFIAD